MGTGRSCWGIAADGRLGYANGFDIGDNEAPASAGDVDVGGTVTQIALGEQHTCALLDTGAVRCWGDGANGRLGYGNTNDIGDNETPASAGDIDVGGTVTQIDAGAFHTCALLDTGSVRCWGAGGFGRLGYGNSTTIGDDETPATAGDVVVGGLVTQIATGGSHTCALLSGGDVRCWGRATDGALGYANGASIGDDETPASAGDVEVGSVVSLVTLGLVGQPAGAGFAPGAAANPVAANFSWVPAFADVGTYSLIFRAQDSNGLTVAHVITIQVYTLVSDLPGVLWPGMAAMAGLLVLAFLWGSRRVPWRSRPSP